MTAERFNRITCVFWKVFTQAAHSSKEDVALAVDKAKHFKHEKTSATGAVFLLNKIAQVIEDNLEYLATVETIDNGKAIRETMAADIPWQ
jgi:aldehyde dehydrogenase